MIDKFKYSGKVGKSYQYWKPNPATQQTDLSVFSYEKQFDTVVSAYAFSNVDAFGAQVLCWQKADLSSSMLPEIKAKAGQDYSYISAEVEADMKQLGNEGWVSLNSSKLKPM